MYIDFLKKPRTGLSIVLDKKIKNGEIVADFKKKVIKFGYTNDNIEYMGSVILDYMRKNNLVDVDITAENDDDLTRLLLGIELSDYKFDKYLSDPSKKMVGEINIVSSNVEDIVDEYGYIKKLKDAIFFCRDLVNEPANYLTPDVFGDLGVVLENYGLSVETYNKKEIIELGMNSLLAVSKGSAMGPKLLVIKWHGCGTTFKDPVALVGKGITFDSGGLCLKPSEAMYDMKCDMAGLAVVVSTLKLLAEREARVNAIGVIPIAENMPSGSAIRPGDIIQSLSKQTIEVVDTDAEGRLILADALYYTKTKFKPKVIVDLATLTGACCVALGSKNAGFFTNNDKLAKELEEASAETREYLWRLPLDELGGTYDKMMDSEVADVKNLSGVRLAGAITAAQFLQRFIDKHDKWAHIDIAGTAFLNAPELYAAKEIYTVSSGATGYGIRLLDSWIRNNYEK